MDDTTQQNQQGDNVLGDKNIFQSTRNRHAKLRELFRKYEYEKENDIKFQSLIEDLEHYTTSKETDVIGVEEKLKNGNRDNFIDYALEVKERYSKKLLRHQFYESAQKINVYLLALVKSYYMNSIYPMICNGDSEVVINELITIKIIDPLTDALEGDTLGFHAEDIQGMLYYLTGNCHIKWNK